MNELSSIGFIIERIIDAKIAVVNESIKAPLDREKASFNTNALTIKENNPKVIIVNGKDKSFKIGLIKLFTIINIRAVIASDLISVNDMPVNNKSIIYRLMPFVIQLRNNRPIKNMFFSPFFLLHYLLYYIKKQVLSLFD